MQNVIEVKNISKEFKSKGKTFYALKNVSFSVRKGEIFGFLGPNGAGKTTMINILMDILTEDGGKATIFGKDMHKDKTIYDKMSFVSGVSRFHWSLKVKNVLDIYSRVFNIPKSSRQKRIAKFIDFFGLKDSLNKKFFLLSTGERVRLIFAKAMINHPELLIMDEPTLGLDPDIAIKVRNEIKRVNKKFKTTILMTSHYMHEVEQLSDRIAFINKGEIVDIGSVERVKRKNFSTYEVVMKVKQIKNKNKLKKAGFTVKGNKIYKKIPSEKNISEILHFLTRNKLVITDVETRKPTLEDYFVKISGGK